jgi:hypothetical protein
MTRISKEEFARICKGISDDRSVIYRHNPIGTENEVLLWMLLCCLISYLNLSENETPCFTGTPDEKTYREAILFVMRNGKITDFDVEVYLNELTKI